MSAVRAYAMWKIKENISISKEELTYFSPGGFTFTHRSGKNVSFDFCESSGGYEEEDKLLDFNLKEIDNDYITSSLEQDKNTELIQEQYGVEFFKNGKFNFLNNHDEMYCCMDVCMNGQVQEEVDFSNYIEPVYFAVFNPYNSVDDTEYVELYNNLNQEQYNKYFREEVVVVI